MSLFTAQLHPGRALGFLVLGAALHDVLTRLKAEPQRFPKLDLAYSPTDPVREPVVLSLPANGLRLRFDGPEQRLRLIEVLDFAKNHIVFKEQNKDRDLVKPATDPAAPSAGPTFRHIYSRFLGPTYDGEYIPGVAPDDGTYVLSYPGVAFTFPMPAAAYAPDKDVVWLLSTPASLAASSMAVFSGDSWAHARRHLWTEALPALRSSAPPARGRDAAPDEIALVRIHGAGHLQLLRRWSAAAAPSFWITLGVTTPQELVAELGPPDAVYRKNDQRMYIHKMRTASSSRSRAVAAAAADGSGPTRRRHDDPLTDTDQSSVPTASSEDDDLDDDADRDQDWTGSVTGECFFNYFHLGFDVLVSTPEPPSRSPPSKAANGTAASTADAAADERPLTTAAPDRLVATKIVLHGNVPGSYPFNRHRRCRWEIAYLGDDDGEEATVHSESPFAQTEERLRAEWKAVYASDDEARQRQRGMVLNRGWGDSPGSSIELLGGWEGHKSGALRGKGAEDSTTTLYGFPGLVFEVLRNGFVGALTVF